MRLGFIWSFGPLGIRHSLVNPTSTPTRMVMLYAELSNAREIVSHLAECSYGSSPFRYRKLSKWVVVRFLI